MEIWVNLEFGDGNFERGFSNINLEVTVANAQGNITQLEVHPERSRRVQLPSNSEIPVSYQRWKEQYYSLLQHSRGGFKKNQVTHISKTDCYDSAQRLCSHLHQWLSPIQSELKQALPQDFQPEIRLVIHTQKIESQITKDILHRLPWQEWDFFAQNLSCEAAVCFHSCVASPTASKESSTAGKIRRARILSIFGDSTNIDTSVDKELLQKLQKRAAELIVLTEPNRSEFNALWEEPCDILFFGGHSETQADGQIGIININPNDSLSLAEIKRTLSTVINKGLKLAIFNSCNGLGLARQLASLNLPYIIVWREEVPDKLAQKFLQYFLSSFSQGESLFNSVRQARDKLSELADEQDIAKQLPGVNWLPIICQNTTEPPPSWEDLGGLSGELPECPYHGLSAFGEKDADFFFGREKFIASLVEAVNSKSLVPVVGASGSGKSSVVFAGLIPRLRSVGNVGIVSFRPGKNPFDSLAIALSKYCQFPVQRQSEALGETASRFAELEFEVNLRHDETVLCNVLENIIHSSGYQRLVLVADQFEELYTLAAQEERHSFLNVLLLAVKFVRAFTLVLTLRADFLGIVLDYQPMGKALQKYTPLLLTPMDKEELRDAIEKPALKMKVELEEGLTSKLINSVGDRPGRLPLLEFALTQLWSKQKNWYLTHKAYEEIGGLEKALAKHADEVLKNLSEEEKQQAQRVFIQLVRPGEGTEDTKRVATRNEVGNENWGLVQQLADARLLVTGWDETEQIETVEIVHEALIREWGNLRRWVNANRQFRIWQERLRGALQQWEINGNDEGALLRGAPLAEAEDWLQMRRLDVGSDELVFIQLSLELRDREQKQQQKRRRLTIFGLASFSIFASILAGLAVLQWRRAETIQEGQIIALSRYSNLLVRSNRELVRSNREFDALIDTIKVGKPLRRQTVSHRTRQQFLAALREAIYKVRERNRLEGHNNWVNSVSFSPDGKTIATASDDKTIKLWSLDGRLLRTIPAHEARVTRVVFSPNGQNIASASTDHTVKLWSLDGRLLRTIQGHKNDVWGVNFSPDGQIIATASDDNTVKLWNLNGQLLLTLDKHQFWVRSVNFSPDGKTIATASRDFTVKLWSLDGRLLHDLKGHKDWVDSVSFSPDGKLLVSASKDKTIIVWNINGQKVKIIPAHDGWVRSATFSPDGKTIASVSADRTIKLWSLDGQLLKTIAGHDDWVNSVSFSPNGQLFASASHDKTVKLWNFDIQLLPTLKGHSKDVNSVVFSPDGKTIATASDDNTVRLWNLSGQELQILKGHSDKVRQVVFSPDGQTIATASEDKSVKLWNKNGQLLSTFTGHNNSVHSVAFSPDGKNILTASEDKSVKLWSLDGEVLRTFTDKKPVLSASFSPDGRTIATGSQDYSVKLWSIDGQLLHTLDGHNSWVRSVVFSPDGQIIASASDDKTVKLWSRDGKLLRTLTGHNDEIRSVRFSPDGQTIASSGKDKTVKLWSLNGDELQTLTGSKGDVNSATFSPDGQIIAYAGEDKLVILRKLDLNKWVTLSNSDLEQLLVRGCDWVRDYLKNNRNVSESDRTLCNGIGTQK